MKTKTETSERYLVFVASSSLTFDIDFDVRSRADKRMDNIFAYFGFGSILEIIDDKN